MQNILIRAVFLYLACLLVMRIMGKRQIGQLQPFELVISFLVTQLAASPMGDSGILFMYECFFKADISGIDEPQI